MTSNDIQRQDADASDFKQAAIAGLLELQELRRRSSKYAQVLTKVHRQDTESPPSSAVLSMKEKRGKRISLNCSLFPELFFFCICHHTMADVPHPVPISVQAMTEEKRAAFEVKKKELADKKAAKESSLQVGTQ